MIFGPKRYAEARMVAVQAHGNQVYDGMFPYSKHLDDVVEVLKEFGYAGRFIIAGYLHDSLEDTALSYNKIKNYFGTDVAEMVYSVTDELGRNRAEKQAKTLDKIRLNPDAIVLKLADRIANVRHGGKIKMYVEEYPEFSTRLYRHRSAHFKEYGDSSMWAELERLLGV